MAKTNLVSICFWRQYIDSVTPATGLLLTVLVLVVGCSESLTGSKKDSAETDGSRTGSILSRASDSARSASQTLSSAVDSNQPKRVEGKASAAVSNPKPNKASLLDNVPLSNTPIFRTAPSNDDIATIIDEAKPFFDHLAVLFPKDSDAYDIRGRFYYFLGDHLTARSCWEKVLIHHPTEPYCLCGLGLIHQLEGDVDAALQCFRKALEQRPEDPTLKQHVARSLIKLGHIPEAIHFLYQSSINHPDSVSIWELLGYAYLSNQDYSQAREAYEEALQRSPNSPTARKGLVQSLMRLGLQEDATRLMGELQEQSADPYINDEFEGLAERREISQYLVAAASIYLKMDRLQEALATLKYAIACSPQEAFPVEAAMSAYRYHGKNEEAIAIAFEGLKRNPKENRIRFALLDLLLPLNQVELAFRVATDSVKHAPDDASARELLTRVLLISGRNSIEAVQSAEKLLKLRGIAGDFALYAQSLHAAGNAQKAIAAMERAIQLEPSNKDYHTILNWLKLEQR